MYAEFLSRLHQQKNPQLFLSYYQEIYEGFLDLFLPENLHYRSPQYLENLGTYCATMQDSGLKELKDPVFKRAFQELNLRRIAVNFYTGDISGALLRLNLELKDFKLDSNVGNQEKFLGIYAYLIQSGIAIPEQLEEIRVEWEEMAGGASDDTVWIPLVEKGQIEAESGLITATIQPLKVEVELRRRDATRDMIFFNNHPMGNNDLIYYQAMDAVSVAKKQLKTKNGVKSSYFRVMFGFPDTGYFYTGESFGLGMSLAVLAQMQKVTIQRTQHKILKNTVITGGVDVNGKVRGISELSLPAKIQAFYYSPFHTFVHPEINAGVAELAFQELSANSHSHGSGTLPPGVEKHGTERSGWSEGLLYPKQRLREVYPVESVAVVLKNLSITTKDKISLREWSKTHLRKNQVLRYLAAILLLAGMGWGGWFYSRDTNPVSVKIEGNILKAINSQSKLIWSHEIFPYEFVNNHDAALRGRPQAYRFQLLVEDIDQNGKNEILYSIIVSDKDYSGRLTCLNATGELRWEIDLGERLRFGESEYEPPYLMAYLGTTSATKDSSTMIVAALNQTPYFPAKLALIRTDGHIISTYAHAGHIGDVELMDITGDGLDEVVFGGINNESRKGVLGILELGKLSGHSPQAKDHYRHTDSPLADHLYYLAFPKLDWIDVGQKNISYAINNIRVMGNGSFSVQVGTDATGLYANYGFLKNMVYEGCGLSDNTLNVYLNYHGHEIKDDYNHEEINRNLNDIKSWDSETWVDFMDSQEPKGQ